MAFGPDDHRAIGLADDFAVFAREDSIDAKVIAAGVLDGTALVLLREAFVCLSVTVVVLAVAFLRFGDDLSFAGLPCSPCPTKALTWLADALALGLFVTCVAGLLVTGFARLFAVGLASSPQHRVESFWFADLDPFATTSLDELSLDPASRLKPRGLAFLPLVRLAFALHTSPKVGLVVALTSCRTRAPVWIDARLAQLLSLASPRR